MATSFGGAAQSIAEGSNYFRLLLQHPVNAWNPQVGEAIMFGNETGFNFWKAQAFTEAADLSDPAISGPDADPRGSGIPNLYRYFADLPIDVDDWSRVPQLAEHGGTLHYGIPFDANKLDGLTRVRSSVDLKSWNTSVFDSAEDAFSLEDGWLYIDVSHLPDSEARFFRLELSL